MPTPSNPIACQLTVKEKPLRKDQVAALLRNAKFSELNNGYAIHFPIAPGLIAQLGQFIEQEIVCCPFLTFQPTVAAEAADIRLDLTGPPGAKEILKDFFPRDRITAE